MTNTRRCFVVLRFPVKRNQRRSHRYQIQIVTHGHGDRMYEGPREYDIVSIVRKARKWLARNPEIVLSNPERLDQMLADHGPKMGVES